MRDPLKIGCGIVLGFIGVGVVCGGIALALTLFCGLTAPSVEEAIEETGREIATEMAEQYQVTSTPTMVAEFTPTATPTKAQTSVPTPTSTRVVIPSPTSAATPTPQLYGEFYLVLFERAETFDLRGEWDFLSWELGPEEGIDIALVVVRLTNTSDRWIFPWVNPGGLTDTQGERYREHADFLIDEQGHPDSADTIVLYSEGGPLVLTGGLVDEKIGPSESLLMGFIIHVPKGRQAASFIFQYEVWETAMPLVGDSWEMEATLSLNGK